MSPNKYTTTLKQEGIALLEALIAIVILGIGLLGAVGMQANAIAALNDAGVRSEATLAVSKLAGIMSTDVGNVSQYAFNSGTGGTPSPSLQLWHQETVANIPNATVVIAPGAGGDPTRVDVTISWKRKLTGPTDTHKITFHVATSR